MTVRAIGRMVTAVAAVVVAAAGVAGCRTNVGSAASIDGHRVSESTVNGYVTSKAKPVSLQTGGSIAPRPFVVDVLIQERLYGAVLAATPNGAPTAAQLSTLRHRLLGGVSINSAATRLGITGYTSSFNSKLVDVQVLATVLRQEEQSAGVNVTSLLDKLSFPVSVNPRYGVWDAKNFRFESGTAAGVPSYLTLQGSSAQQ